MKYGDTLQQRSIPLWESYNIDYNDIKHLIKVRTTHGHSQAKAIPGSSIEVKESQKFEDELYKELRDQHQRISLFVRSKSGEINRRLAHLDKQIAQLGLRSFSGGQTKISVRRLEKFSRIEEAALKVGEDIQSLSRFVGAQVLAFQKLLKKYKKWTSSAELGIRFRSEVLDRPSSFSKQDFEPLLEQWTEVLNAVRAPFANGVNWQSELGRQGKPQTGPLKHKHEANQSSNRDPNSVADLHAAWESGSNIEIDTALAILPLGRGATKAAYWVHPDNIVQVHVLLLQYTRVQRSEDSVSSSGSRSSSRSTPHGSSCGLNGRHGIRTDDEIGCIICDDLERFAKMRSSETISASEESPGTAAEKAAASIRYSTKGEVIVAVDTICDNASPGAESYTTHLPRKAKFKRKALRQLFEASRSEQCPKADESKESQRVREWLDEHQEVQPLVQVQARRTRFVGLKNDDANGIWTTLDKDVVIRKCPAERLANGDYLSPPSEQEKDGSETFPHAVLEVRIEGDGDTGMITALDSSHLTERVRGFSLETHAVATLCKPQGMPRPFWLPALQQDIRKIPAASKPAKIRITQGRLTPEESSTRHTSVSASSTTRGLSSSGLSAQRGESSATSAPDAITPPPLDAFKKKRRRSHRKEMARRRLEEASRSKQQRYWNEFDDGSEGSENEGYTIFVDPNASYTFPGADAFSKLYTSLSSSIKASKKRVSSWLTNSTDGPPEERQPLINDTNCMYGTHSPSVDDSDDETSPLQRNSSLHHHYSTFPSHSQPHAERARETLLFRAYLASFCASFILLIIAAILETTGRRKAESTVDAGVIIGVAASLVFAIIAVGSMVGRKDNVGWVHRASVSVVFVCVLLGSGGLLAALRNSTGRR